MTTHNFQQAYKMSTLFVGIKKTMNQPKRSKLSNLLFSICLGVIFLSGLLNLLSTSGIVVAEEAQPAILENDPPIENDVPNPLNSPPANIDAIIVAGSNGVDGDLTVAISETRYVDEVRTNLAARAFSGSTQIQVIDSTNFTGSQEILIMQMNGDEVGQYETAVIDSVSNNILSLTSNLSNTYEQHYMDNVIVQVIPNYRIVNIQDGGTLTAHPWTGNGSQLNTGGVLFFRAMTVTVAAGGQIVADGLGFAPGQGPGAGTQGWSGSHGGGRPGSAYGDPYQPKAMGSGGYTQVSTPSGSGGGLIFLDVTYSLQNDGAISAHGGPGIDSDEPISYFDRCGTGGAGGSVWIQAHEINGIGMIGAAGGDGGQCVTSLGGNPLDRIGMAGAGGRIALYADTDQFSRETDAFQIFGGDSSVSSPGTIYLNTNIYPQELWTDNNGHLASNYPAVLVEGTYVFNRLRLFNGASLSINGTSSQLNLNHSLLVGEGVTETKLVVGGELLGPVNFEVQDMDLEVYGRLSGVDSLTTSGDSKLSLHEQNPTYFDTYTFDQITIGSNSTLLLYPVRNNDTNYTNDTLFHLNVDTLIIEPDGLLSASGLGYSTNLGPGRGINPGDGAGHGGYDASGNGIPYGDIYQPVALGSGGHTNGGTGGGAIRLEGDTLQNDGLIAVNGQEGYSAPSPSSSCGGGGSGGSLWIDVNVISGTGTFEAFGGAGGDCSPHGIPNGFGGSGGRIALYAEDDTFSHRDNAYNVNGAGAARPGTIYLDGYVSLDAHPALLPSGESSSLMVTVQTNESTPVANKGISLTVNSDVAAIVNDAGQPITPLGGFYSIGETDNNGTVAATLVSTQTGALEVIAWESGIWASPVQMIAFDVSHPSGAESNLSIVGNALIAADGTNPARLRVTARDQFGNPFSGLSATLASSEPAVSITPVSAETNSEGFFDFEVRHNVPGSAMFTATISSDTITEVVSQTAVVTFVGADLHVYGNNLPSEQATGLEVSLPLIVRNEGYVLAENVVVTVTLPSELNFNGPIDGAVVYDSDNHLVIWTIGDLGASNNVALTLQTEIDETAPFNQQIATTVTASTTSIELNIGNNSFTHTMLVVEPSPHVVITSATNDHYLEIGETAVHTLKVANPGTAVAQGLNLNTHYNWVTLIVPSLPQTLPIDETQDWILEFDTAGVANGRYLDNIEIGGSNVPTQTIPTTIHVGDYAQNVTVNISNTADAAVKNATISLVRDTTRDVYINNVFEESEPVQVTGKTNIKGELLVPYLAAGTYTMTVTAEKHDPFVTLVSVDANTSQLGAQLVAYPSLEFVTKHRELSVLAGGSAEYQLVVRNNGPGHAEGFTLQTPENLSWLAAALPAGIDRLAANEEMVVTILLNPEVDQALNSYLTEPIIIDASNADPDQVQLTIHVTTIDVGFLAFRVKDQSGEPIEDAKVTIISQEERVVNGTGGAQAVTRDWYTAVSDSNGDVVFNDLALTDYSYFVESNGFYIEEGVQAAQPVPIDAQALIGKHGLFKPTEVPPVSIRSNTFVDALVELFLNRKPFSVSWEVEPVTINDTYAFTVEVTYEATENVAGLFISHETFCTPPDSPGSDNEDWLIVNTGPVTMTDIVLNPSYNPIWPIPFDVLQWDVAGERISGNWEDGRFLVAEELAPGASITVPFTVTARVPGTDIHGGDAWLAVEGQYELENGEIADYKVNNLGNLKHCQGGQETEMVWTVQRNGSIVGVGSGSQLPDMGDGPPAVPVNTDVALLMQIGEATLERQGFMGTLILDPDANTYLEDVMISINIYEEDSGADVTSQFVIGPESPTELGSILYEAEQEWLMVPGDLGITQTKGADYNVTARIDYTVNENERSYTTQPATIRIYPPPKINLDYTYSQPQEDGSFYIEVEAENEGFGPAKNLVLDLSELFMDKIDSYGDVDNNDRSLVFELMETTVGGDPQPLNGFEFDFGTIAPSTTITGRWTISVTASDGAYMKDAVITKFSVKCRHLPYKGLQLSSLINCDDHNDFIYVENPYFFCLFERQRVLGGPINTTTGNYSYVQNGFSLPTLGDPLQFNWAYNSLNVGAFPDKPPTDSPLGVGWSYDHNMWLDLQASNVITLHTDTGTAVRIDRNGDILTPADEKFCADMAVEDAGNGRSLYTLHSDNQTTFVFSDTGKLISRTDAQGNDIFFTYEENSENISRVADPVSGQSLDFTYDETTGRLELVTEVTGRTIDFVYDATTGMLSRVVDARGQEWRYEYTQLTGGQDVMYRVLDPDQRLVEETGFDEFGRAITQTYNGRSLTITYDGQRRIVNDGNGGETVLFYNRKDLLVGERNALGDSERYAFDLNQNRIWNENESAVAMNVENNPAGYKTFVENALGQSFHFEYDDHNNMTYMQDALGNEAFYTYNEFNKPISITNFLGDQLYYTYNNNGQKTSILDENGYLTQYGYDDLGRQTVVTNALGYTTYTAYDDAWRIISSTDALGKVTSYSYDAADNLLQKTENVWEGQPQNYLDEYNIVTEYGYDGRGNQTHMTDTLGFVTRSFYGVGNVLEGEIVNWQGTITNLSACQFPPTEVDKDLCTVYEYDNEENLIVTTDPLGRQSRTFYDSLNRLIGTINNWDGVMTPETCQFPPLLADQNLCTLYQYDEVGNQVLMTDTVGHQTYTFYNDVNREVGKISNWQGAIHDLSACQFPPVEVDKDLCTLNQHDEKGQIIITTDPLGRQTRTFYDALGRKIGEVANWQPGFTLDDCVLSPDNLSQTNVCTLYQYDKVGNQTVMTNALGQKTLTVYDALNRTVATVANWDGINEVNDAADCDTLPSTADQNVCSTISYDALGRILQTTDALGNSSSLAYDSLGRVITTTRYLSNTLVETVKSYDALGRIKSIRDAHGHVTNHTYDDLGRTLTVTSPEGVVTTQTYDAVGRLLRTTDGLLHTTQQEYDDLNRPVRMSNAEGDVTERKYDALGNMIALIDSEGVRTEHEYDALNRLTTVIENAGGTTANSSNIRTEYTYDALGNQLTTVSDRILDDGQTEMEVTEYDQLNRPVRIIDELERSTEKTYDALGNTRVLTDANGEVTLFTYDGLNRTISVNYVADGQTVTYSYDALGNPRLMTDDLGSTHYDYDDLYRLIEVVNPFDKSVGYAYDLLGNRTRLTYPDGKVVSYTYDADNRLSTVTDWLSGTTRYEYDLAGRLITTTLPNGVISTQQYDDANRLTNLRYEQDDGTTVAQYGYQLNDLGFREVVTETIYIPEIVDEVHAFIEQNGLLVMEAEHGQGHGDATTHTWAETVVLPDYSGDSYLQALPDIGQRYNTNNVVDSPQRSYLMSITNAADYTLWVRGMAADPAGDSLHVGLNGNVLADATKLTGFAPREWSWTTVTMDNLTATVNLTSTSLYTLDLWMREDGLRIDQLVLTDDPDYTPTSTLAESPYGLVNSNATGGHLSTWTIDYDYDPLRRLTNATYSGDISATFAYDYDPVGNMTAYTETIAFDSQETQTKQVVRYFDDANKMITSTDSELGTTSYHYDDNGNLIEILPPISSEQQPVRYTYDQRNLLLTSAVDNGNGSFAPRITYLYDGNGQRISLIDYGTVIGQIPATTTFTNDISGLSQVLMSDDGATQTAMLYGRDLIGSSSSNTLTEMNISLADGLGSARIEMVDADIMQATTYGPYGNVFHTVGEAGTVYGFTGEETDPTGLIYLRARYYNPALRTFMSRDPFNGYRDRPQSQNGYTYVEGNPVNYIDPTGEFAELIALYATIETAFDIYVFYEDLRVVLFDFQNPECGNLTADLIALGLDGLALIPFISSTMDDVGGLFARADDAPTVSRLLNGGDAAFGLPTTTEEFLDWRYGYSQAMNATDTHVFGRFGEIKANFDIPANVNNLDAIEGSRVLNVGDDWTPAVNRGYVDAAADAAIIENRPIILVSDPTDLVGTHGKYNEELGVWSNSITSHELAIFDSYGFTAIPGSDGNWLLLPPNFH